MIENMIPFRVKPRPLANSVYFRRCWWDDSEYSRYTWERLEGKVWMVTAIKPNPYPEVRDMHTGSYTELCLMQAMPDMEHVPCTLFLLIREGEVPAWWPAGCCEAVGVASE